MTAVDEICQEPRRYLDAFPRDKWSGPSIYFHKKTLGRLKVLQWRPSAAARDARYLEYLYATLTAWGLHRMGAISGRLVDFDQFSQKVAEVGPTLDQLRDRAIDTLRSEDQVEITSRLSEIVNHLRLRPTNKPSVVVATKTLHHLLPYLVVPIDGKHTFEFFGRSRASIEKNPGKFFIESYADFIRIANCIKPFASFYLEKEFHTNLAKMVDNAIVAYEVLKGGSNKPNEVPGTESSLIRDLSARDAYGTNAAHSARQPDKKDFIQALSNKLNHAQLEGKSFIDIRAGDLHKEVDGSNRMPTCCSAMEELKQEEDEYLYRPPMGRGANLRIRYHLPR